MPNVRYMRSVGVLLLAFLLSVLCALLVYGVAILAWPTANSNLAPALSSLSALLAVCFCLRLLATRLLYDKNDSADLQLIGGARFGDILQAVFSGKGASWPFAKLSASRKELRLQTPFGVYAWKTDDVLLSVSLTGGLNIETVRAGQTSVLFFATPWQRARLKKGLKQLGYPL